MGDEVLTAEGARPLTVTQAAQRAGVSRHTSIRWMTRELLSATPGCLRSWGMNRRASPWHGRTAMGPG
jgi:hypothetical protein